MSEASLELPGTLWHVTVTANGDPIPLRSLQEALAALEFAHPFGLSARYTDDLVELRYWDEGSDCSTVTSAALRLWDEHRLSAGLPAWAIIGVEVIDRPTFRRRWPKGSDTKQLLSPGIRPLP